MLNEEKTAEEIGDALNLSASAIRKAISDGKINRPTKKNFPTHHPI
jgi:hypothetical protein